MGAEQAEYIGIPTVDHGISDFDSEKKRKKKEKKEAKKRMKEACKTRKKNKRRSCFLLCCSNVELGSIQQDEDDEMKKGGREKEKASTLPIVNAFSSVNTKEGGSLVLRHRSRLILCCSNLEVGTKSDPAPAGEY